MTTAFLPEVGRRRTGRTPMADYPSLGRDDDRVPRQVLVDLLEQHKRAEAALREIVDPYGSFLLERRPGGFQEIVGWVPRDYDVPDEGLPEGVSLVRVPGWVEVNAFGVAAYMGFREPVEAVHRKGMP